MLTLLQEYQSVAHAGEICPQSDESMVRNHLDERPLIRQRNTGVNL